MAVRSSTASASPLPPEGARRDRCHRCATALIAKRAFTAAELGRGFAYYDEAGRPVTDERQLERFRSLVIPPAWTDVWICRAGRGHLQATGRDEAGRKQYRYHPAWRADRDREKYERIVEFAERLPAMRRTVRRHLRANRIHRERALGAAVAVLDRTAVRIGGEEYARRNGTFGLATLRSRHLTLDGDRVILDFSGKAGARQRVELDGRRLARTIAAMDRLPGHEIFKYRGEDGEIVDVRSLDINDYIKTHMGEAFSAKDFSNLGGDRGRSRGPRSARYRDQHEGTQPSCRFGGAGRRGPPREHSGRLTGRATSTRASSTTTWTAAPFRRSGSGSRRRRDTVRARRRPWCSPSYATGWTTPRSGRRDRWMASLSGHRRCRRPSRARRVRGQRSDLSGNARATGGVASFGCRRRRAAAGGCGRRSRVDAERVKGRTGPRGRTPPACGHRGKGGRRPRAAG